MGIGTVLLDRELITRQQLDDAIHEQARSGEGQTPSRPKVDRLHA